MAGMLWPVALFTLRDWMLSKISITGSVSRYIVLEALLFRYVLYWDTFAVGIFSASFLPMEQKYSLNSLHLCNTSASLPPKEFSQLCETLLAEGMRKQSIFHVFLGSWMCFFSSFFKTQDSSNLFWSSYAWQRKKQTKWITR